jgi:hypothetical protein
LAGLALASGLSLSLPWLAPDFESESHWFTLALWLLLGSLFAAPFSDLLQVAWEIDYFVIPSINGRSLGQMVTFWCSAPVQLNYIFSIFLTLIVYFWGYRLGIGIYRSGKLAFLELFQLERLDWIMLLLAFVSLVNSVVNRFVGNLIWIQLPGNSYRGTLGFVIGWIIVVLLSAILLVFMNRQLLKMENELDDRA